MGDESRLRDDFHRFLTAQGFREFTTPPPGKSYPSAHVDLLWQCYKQATMDAQARNQPAHAAGAP